MDVIDRAVKKVESIKLSPSTIDLFFALLEFAGEEIESGDACLQEIARLHADDISPEHNTFRKKLESEYPKWLADAVVRASPDIEKNYNMKCAEINREVRTVARLVKDMRKRKFKFTVDEWALLYPKIERDTIIKAAEYAGCLIKEERDECAD